MARRGPNSESEKLICAAIREARINQGLTQAEVAQNIGAPQSYMTRWETSRVPSLDDLRVIEVVGLGVPAGTTLRVAGFVDSLESEPDSVLAAIDRDIKLTTAMKCVLASAYQAAIGDPK